MSARPKVSVIVPHYRDMVRLSLCLDALERQSYPRSDFEIVVSDNNSPEGEAAVAEAIAGRARLVIAYDKGAGPTRNAGVAASQGEILAFTDSDCVPEADWLRQGVLALDRFDFVGGRMEVLVEDPRAVTAAEAFEQVFAFDNRTYVEHKGFTVTANLFCARALFDRVGGFRVGVSEDLDWSHRAVAAGYRIGYAADAGVGHPARRTWAELVTKWRRLNLEAYGLVSGSAAGRLKWRLKSLALPLSALAHTPKVLASRRLGSTFDRVLALAMLYRLRLWRTVDSLRLSWRAPAHDKA